MKPDTIAPLTSLRFIFALFVFLSHLGFLSQGRNDVFSWLFDHVFYEGYIGVSFFFMLSGFVLALNYKNKISTKQISIRQFMAARIARIFPMHFITLLVAIPLTYSVLRPIDGMWVAKLISNGLLVQGFIPVQELCFSFNIVSWSISDELFFYCMFPLLILFGNKIGMKKSGIVLLILVITNILLFFLLPGQLHHIFLYVSPFVRIIDFIIGIALFEVFWWLKNKPTAWNFSYLEWGSVLLFILFFSLHEFVPEGLRYSIFYWPAMCMILLVFAFQKGAISRFLSCRIMVFLGEISFSFYLIHWLAIRYIGIVNKRFFSYEEGILFALAIFVFSLVASAISYQWIEQPAGKWIKKVLIRKDNT